MQPERPKLFLVSMMVLGLGGCEGFVDMQVLRACEAAYQGQVSACRMQCAHSLTSTSTKDQVLGCLDDHCLPTSELLRCSAESGTRGREFAACFDDCYHRDSECLADSTSAGFDCIAACDPHLLFCRQSCSDAADDSNLVCTDSLNACIGNCP